MISHFFHEKTSVLGQRMKGPTVLPDSLHVHVAPAPIVDDESADLFNAGTRDMSSAIPRYFQYGISPSKWSYESDVFLFENFVLNVYTLDRSRGWRRRLQLPLFSPPP